MTEPRRQIISRRIQTSLGITGTEANRRAGLLSPPTFGRVGRVEYIGGADGPCECGGRVTVDSATTPPDYSDPEHIRWTDIQCDRCGTSYTVEVLRCTPEML